MPAFDQFTSFSREEAESYVGHALVLRGETAIADANLNRQELAGILRLLPPDAQALVMLGGDRFHLTAADFQEVQNAYLENGGQQGRAGAVGGFYSPTSGAVVYEAGAKNADGTYRHEHGHAVDKELGYISNDPKWVAAVETEMANRRLDPGRSIIAQSVLPDSRTLSQHLNGFYDKQEYASEALAEMTNHYYSSYANNLGDMAKVNADLSRAYPDLWPAYQEVVLPKMQALAEEVQKQAFAHIDDNIRWKEKISQMTGETIDIEAERTKARATIIGTPDGTKALLAENENLVRVIDRMEGITKVVDSQQQFAELTGQEFDRKAAMQMKIQEVSDNPRLFSADLSQQAREYDALAEMAKQKGGDMALLAGLGEDVTISRTSIRGEAAYTLRLNGDVKDSLARIEEFDNQLKEMGITPKIEYARGGGGKGEIITYTIPVKDMPPEILAARAKYTGEDLDGLVAEKRASRAAAAAGHMKEGAGELAHAASTAGHVAQETGTLSHLWGRIAKRLPGIGVAAAVAGIVTAESTPRQALAAVDTASAVTTATGVGAVVGVPLGIASEVANTALDAASAVGLGDGVTDGSMAGAAIHAAIAVHNSVSTIERTPAQKQFDAYYDALPTKVTDDMSPEMKELVMAKSKIEVASAALEVNRSVGVDMNGVSQRANLEKDVAKSEANFEEIYTRQSAANRLPTINSPASKPPITPPHEVETVVAGLPTPGHAQHRASGNNVSL